MRTSGGVEVDLIIDRKRHKEMFEIKKIATFKPKMLHAMKVFLKPNDQGCLLYNGKSVPYSDQISLSNYQDYLSKWKHDD